jgi:hypothetical protein
MMRSLILASMLLLLTYSPAQAVKRDLDFTGLCVSEAPPNWFGPASDDALLYTLNLSLASPSILPSAVVCAVGSRRSTIQIPVT